jgi:hypothetical protein
MSAADIIQRVNQTMAEAKTARVENPYDKVAQPLDWLMHEVKMLAEVSDFHASETAGGRRPLASAHWGGRAEAFRHARILVEQMQNAAEGRAKFGK